MKIKNMLLAGIFTALMIVSSYIVIPIGVVPHTLQPFIVLLTGFLLVPPYGIVSLIAWILLGCMGLPVFNQGQAGVNMLIGPTGGFILAFALSTQLLGLMSRKAPSESVVRNFFYMVITMLFIYAVGLVGFKFNMATFLGKNLSWEKSMLLCVAPFLPFDLVKAALASYVGVKVRKALRAAGIYQE